MPLLSFSIARPDVDRFDIDRSTPGCAAPARNCAAVLVLVLAVAAGCTRTHYRQQADRDVYGLIGRGTQDPRWQLADYTIQADPRSRMFDPDCPDRPPMPPDDPVSHQLMQCVDGYHGWKGWDRKYGRTSTVEGPAWRKSLPCDASGTVVLDRPAAVQVALINSREYQHALETLYLTALDVTYQQFLLDAQFFGGHSTFFTADGPASPNGQQSTLDVEQNIRMKRLMAGGGQFAVGLANSLVWQFAGPDQYTATSLLDFSFVQPLLRGAGRAVVLEGLTESERTLLANVRQMVRYHYGFYVQVLSGRPLGPAPLRGGLTLDAITSAGIAANAGIFGILEQQVQIRNQRANLAGLHDSLDQLEAQYDSGRIDRFQVDLARQSLYNAQSTLLAINTSYGERLDAYKLTLGLPPDTPLRVSDPMLKQFDLIDPQLTATQEAISAFLDMLREPSKDAAAAPQNAATLAAIDKQCNALIEMVAGDLQALTAALPRRRADLKRLAAREESTTGDVDSSATKAESLDRRAAALTEDFARQRRGLLMTLEQIKGEGRGAKGEGRAMDAERLLPTMIGLSDQLSELSLTQARARVETIILVPIELDPCEAMRIACQNRLDWMNARAALVDEWRQIEIAANALRGNLSVTMTGNLGTTDNNPLRFRGTTGRLRAGLAFEAPLTRLAERNAYREVLIDYQRARRAYMNFEDRISQTLRSELRALRVAQLNFELRRAQVRVAIDQVDVTRERVRRPPKPGETTTPSPTLARDLVGAFAGLLTAQNSILGEWVDYETQRLNLDYDLGTMRLDQCNNWIDPGPIGPSTYTPEAPPVEQPEEIPPPQPIPLAAE